MLANLDMGTNRIVDLADGIGRTDAADMHNLSVGLSPKPNIDTVLLRDGSQPITVTVSTRNASMRLI